MNALAEEKKKEIKKNINTISDNYREEQKKAEMLKNIDSIRKKLAAIDSYRKRREELAKKVEEVEKERKTLYQMKEEKMIEM